MNFLFDENLPALARALQALGEPVQHVIDIHELGRGSTDLEIVTYAAERIDRPAYQTAPFRTRSWPRRKSSVDEIQD